MNCQYLGPRRWELHKIRHARSAQRPLKPQHVPYNFVIGGAVIVQNLILPIPCLHKSLLHTTQTHTMSFIQNPHPCPLPGNHFHRNSHLTTLLYHSSHISIYCGGHTMYRYAVHLVIYVCVVTTNVILLAGILLMSSVRRHMLYHFSLEHFTKGSSVAL